MARRLVARFSLVFLALCAISPGLHAKKKPPAAPINLNTATSEELQQVPGIGPVTAEKILQMRKAYGAFKSVDDLSAIRGIGPHRLEKMRKYLVAGKTAPAKKPSATECSSCNGAKAPLPPKSTEAPQKPAKPVTPPAPPADDPDGNPKSH